MPKLPVISGKKLLKYLLKQGEYKLVDMHGSHVIIHCTKKDKKTTIPVHANKDLPKGTLKSIISDLDISTIELIKIISK